MAKSLRFTQLQGEIRRLRRHLLPRQWNPTGSYSERIADRARAFRVLSHAEIEYFIENVILDAVEKKYLEWKGARLPSYVMTCLLAASKVDWVDTEASAVGIIPLTGAKIKKDDHSIHDMIDRAVKQYRNIVDDNHGIKPANLKRLIMPVGIALSDLDPTWLNHMDTFGAKRGAIAHRSRLGLSVPLDPKTESDTVDLLLVGLKELDAMIVSVGD